MGRLKGASSSRRDIVDACLKLVLEKNYGAFSISAVEKATNLTRGSILYHFEDKEDIYYATVEYLMQQIYNNFENFIMVERASLIEFILVYIDNIQNLSLNIRALTDGRQSSYAFFVLQAMEVYPNFIEKYTALYELERKGWETHLKAAIARKEIRDDLDVSTLVGQFQSLYNGVLLQSGLLPQIFNTTVLQSLMMNLYNEIKVRPDNRSFGLVGR